MDNMEKFDKVISELNSDIVCGLTVGMKIPDSSLFVEQESKITLDDKKYKIGTFNTKDVIIDPYMKWGDLRVFYKFGTELINLTDFGFETIDLV
jgi:hypothetical protein